RIMVARVQKAHDQRPFLLGHSMGGLIATRFAIDQQHTLAGLILSSPFFQLKLEVPPIKIAAGKLFSMILPRLPIPSGLRGADVTRDPEIAAAYDRDPLNNSNATARWFTESTAAQEEVFRRAAELTLPCLVLHGGADRIANPRRTEELFARI